MQSNHDLTSFSIILLVIEIGLAEGLKNIYSINCGGPSFTDSLDVKYQQDLSLDGEASDYGLQEGIFGVHPNDMILYQTERYSDSDFSYEIKVYEDGDYLLLLKFSEVWFKSVDMKIFHIRLNGKIILKESLDIFAMVGFRNALDLDYHIKILNNGETLQVNGKNFDYDGVLKIEFLKGPSDNPKINAISLLRGSLQEFDLFLKKSRNIARENSQNQFQQIKPDSYFKALHYTKEDMKKLGSGPALKNPYEMKLSDLFIFGGIFITAFFASLAISHF